MTDKDEVQEHIERVSPSYKPDVAWESLDDVDQKREIDGYIECAHFWRTQAGFWYKKYLQALKDTEKLVSEIKL